MNTLKPGDKVKDKATGQTAYVKRITPGGAHIQFPFSGAVWRSDTQVEVIKEESENERK